MINGKKFVALCTSRIYDPQIHGYIVKFNERLRAEDCSLLIFAINSDIYWEEDRQASEKYVFDLIPYDFIDAVVIMDEKIKSHRIAEKIIRKSNEHQVPVIISDGHYENTSCINFDYSQGFELVVRHIIEEHKVTRPHMFAGQPDNEFSNERIEVFKKVLSENGIPFNNSMISYGYFWADPCRIAMQELLEDCKDKELPEAIICANDVMAITISEMLTENGYKVPEDVLIAGFDGYDEIYFTSPKITTASCDIILLADACADAVFEVIQNKKNKNKYITPVFQPNESCGCAEYTKNNQILHDWFKESFSRHNDDNRVLKRLTAKMQVSQTIGEMVSHLDCYKTDTLLTVVDRRMFDDEENYFTNNENDFREKNTNKEANIEANIATNINTNRNTNKELILIYDSDYREDYKEDTFIFPEYDDMYTEDVFSPAYRFRILQLTESGYPLIFNALDYMGKAFGFVCYYFRDYYISNYTNTMNATNSIGTGIGGYINIQYQRALLDKMDEMYRHDPLTGLFNRIGFHNQFKKICRSRKYQNKEITVIMSDLDGLKFINDHFGHADGDNAIATTAMALMDNVPQNSLSARFGGDEIFSIIFDDCDADKIIKNIDKYLEKYNDTSGKPYDVSTSCGYIKLKLDDNFDITKAVKDADTSMYEVKKDKYIRKGIVPRK